jgi:uncharacterized membrane protein YdjX (TVP38/TMEM64 family)
MIIFIGIALTSAAFLALFLFGRRAGKDAVKSEVAEKTIEQIVDAVRPPTDVDIDRVRSRYRRD